MRYRLFICASTLFAMLSVGAQAQDAAAAAPIPAQSVESFETWTVECATVPAQDTGADAAPAPQRLCEAAQTYRNQDTGNEVARIAFALAADSDGGEKTMRLGMRSLVDVSFANAPEIMSGEAAVVSGEMQRCAGNACYATFPVDDAALEALQSSADLKLRFPIANGSMFQITMSSAGLKDALDVLRARAND